VTILGALDAAAPFVLAAEEEASPLLALLGFAWLGCFGLAIWVWIETLSTPGRAWSAVGRSKSQWFIAWYVGGFFTGGIVPMGMAIWYLARLRDDLQRAKRESIPPAWSTGARSPDAANHPGSVPSPQLDSQLSLDAMVPIPPAPAPSEVPRAPAPTAPSNPSTATRSLRRTRVDPLLAGIVIVLATGVLAALVTLAVRSSQAEAGSGGTSSESSSSYSSSPPDYAPPTTTRPAFPVGFQTLSDDPDFGFRVRDVAETQCDLSFPCWNVEVISSQDCEWGITVTMTAMDSSGAVIDEATGSVSAAVPAGQVALTKPMAILARNATQGRVASIECG